MSDKDVILENRQRHRPFEATLYHAVCCQEGTCHCQLAETAGPDGAPRLELQRKPASFWIAPRSFSEPLPAAVLLIPQVKTARAEGKIHVAGEETVALEVVPGKSWSR